jgi:BlaI family transcriptional regulator, penicillinase repressor
MKLDLITDGELAILQVVWQRGEATSRDITLALHKKVTDPKMSSVQKLIERLEAKGCLARDRSERAHRFRALVSQDDFLRSRLQALADRLCGGALASLMTTLVRSKGISRGDRQQLRKLIDDVWPSPESGKKSSR